MRAWMDAMVAVVPITLAVSWIVGFHSWEGWVILVAAYWLRVIGSMNDQADREGR